MDFEGQGMDPNSKMEESQNHKSGVEMETSPGQLPKQVLSIWHLCRV